MAHLIGVSRGSERFGNDPHRLGEYLRELDKQYGDRVVSFAKPADDEDKSAA